MEDDNEKQENKTTTTVIARNETLSNERYTSILTVTSQAKVNDEDERK